MKIAPTKFSFGATSGIITSLGLIMGLYTVPNAKLSIISSLLILALADNFSDTMGIHVYQDAENYTPAEVWISTVTNFMARFLVSAFFILFFIIFPIKIAVAFSVFYGLLILAAVSYQIAINKKENPFKTILEHVSIAMIVIFASKFVGEWIIKTLAAV